MRFDHGSDPAGLRAARVADGDTGADRVAKPARPVDELSQLLTLVKGLTPALTRRLCEQQSEQRLLRVEAVLRLVPDGRLSAVEHAGRDLLAGVRRQAVEDDHVLGCGRDELLVEAVRLEVA